ncbi:MAG: dihydrodipicolinate synthase family protein, partial [Oscillospiraceae bacterium]|nr:dihydrodipicolinate synthase family protein [Oscillospiraceae bacterium]
PNVVTNMTQACLDGDFKTAAGLQLKYLDLIGKLFIEVNPIPVKAALNLMGMDVGETRLPLVDLAPENLEKLRTAMTAAELFPK